MGNRLKELMRQRGLNLRMLAKRSGIAERRLATIMLDDDEPLTEKEISQLALAFEADRSEIEGRKSSESAMDSRIRWQLGMCGRPDLFDKVKETIENNSTNFRGAEDQPISDLVIRRLINQILDEEDPALF